MRQAAPSGPHELWAEARVYLLYHQLMAKRYRRLADLPSLVTLLACALSLANQSELLMAGLNLMPGLMFIALLSHALAFALGIREQARLHHDAVWDWQGLFFEAMRASEDHGPWEEVLCRFSRLEGAQPGVNRKRRRRAQEAVEVQLELRAPQ